MALFRKRETYNEQMLREAGLDRVVFNTPQPEPPQQEAEPPPFRLDRGLPMDRGVPRDWDAATTATASGLVGDRVAFVTLPNGDLIVSEQEGNGDLSPFADAIEQHVTVPYRAVAIRQSGDLWGIGAKQIEVVSFEFPEADELELSQNDGVSELRVDGEPSGAVTPVELQRLGERAGTEFCVNANRIDGDSWEARVSPL